MEIVFIGNPFGGGGNDTNGSCTSKTCGIHECGIYDCTVKYNCGDDTCDVDKETSGDEDWE